MIGEDSGKTARSIATEEVVKIVSGAPEAFDTLKEIAEWIGDGSGTTAAQIVTDIENLKTADSAITINLNGKVDKVEGKGLSTNDYTTDEKNKLTSVATIINDMPIVKGDAEHSAVLKESENKVNGKFSIAVGYGNNISSNSSAAFGYNNIVENNCCTAEGVNNKVCGDNSHVEGRECIVEGHESHAEGNYTKVYGHCSHGEGTSCRVLGDNSHVEGHSSVVYGHVGHAEGQSCAAGDLDQIEKPSSERTDAACHAEGIRTIAKEMASHSEGIDTHSMGVASHTEGRGTYATADASHAEGLNSKSGLKGYYFKGIDIKNKKIYLSVTKPETIKTSGFASSDFENIEFPYDIESDLLSIINGEIYYDSLKVTKTNKNVIYVESLPFKSIAEINNLYLDSNYTIFCIDKYKLGGVNVSLGSHAEGYNTRSFGIASHTDGYNTISKNLGEHASGIYNVSNGDTQFSIGIGTSDTDRKNAFEVKQNGDIYVEGVEGKIQDKLNTSPDWNAQEGEVGYIENKPFYGGNVIRTVGSGVIMSPKSFTINNYYRAKITTFRYYNSEGEYTDIDFDLKTGFASTIVGDGFELYVSYNINYPNATIEFVELTLNGGWIAFFVDEYDMLKALEDKYIPNTILKTTPQTLSSTDKNQALTNLGLTDILRQIDYNNLKDSITTLNTIITENELTISSALNELNKRLQNIEKMLGL